MEESHRREAELEARIRALESENRELRAGIFAPHRGDTVHAPERFRPLFDAAERTVGNYFREYQADPSKGTIEIAGERYLLVRASALSYGFLSAIRALYADRGDEEALHIGKTLLFDMAHVIGISDARNFHRKMGLTDPVAKLSAGPVHFSHTGWAFVELLDESNPSPDDSFFLTYHHPFSFESDSWIRAGKTTDFAVCVMSAGYSSGWCQESFGIPLTSTEIACKAKGDEHCTFVMAPPHRMRDHIERALADASEAVRRRAIYDIPTLFERKAVEERLQDAVERAEAASEAKSLFLANMSHEIRTPLTGILGMAELLLRRQLEPTERKYVQTIDQSGQALLGILNDILDLSKIEAGMMSVTKGPTDVRAVLQDVQDVLRARVQEKGLDFIVHVEDSLPPIVESDALRLRQIALNLAGNAVKFTSRGSVTVRASWNQPGTLRIAVEDTGVGIDPADVERLFENFAQADSSNSRRYPGAGLGLSIARRLVELMGGELDVCSAPGVGSHFVFVVPAVVGEGEAEPRSRAPVDPHVIDARVLLVEDDRISQFVVEKLLEEHGCQVETVSDGREAVAAVAAGSYDLVLMDCQMPVMDGYEATARIREYESGGRQTPIVAMTASVMQGESERCITAGMDDLLAKPLDPVRLQDVLLQWARRFQKRP